MRRAGTLMRLSLCLGLLSGTANAADSSTAAQWRTLTRTDVEAAYELLEDNHPGTLPEVGDRVFTRALAAAHTKALERAAKVTDLEGHDATLAAFADSMGDGHIWSRSLFLPRDVSWAGIVAAKRGSDWVVAIGDSNLTGTELKGARIVSCSGRPAAELAHDVFQFHAPAKNAALETIRAGWLLVDDGNPFLRRPTQCAFDRAGKRLDLMLHWTKITTDKLFGHIWKAPVGEAGYGVRPSGKGYWIAIQELDVKAQSVLNAVKSREGKIRAAPYVVIDLRGNGGGDDLYGRSLAEELYGARYVKAVLGPSELAANGCQEVFRASPQNIAALTKSAVKFRADGEKTATEGITEAVDKMKKARAAGQTLTGSLTCQPYHPAMANPGTSLMHGKVFVLTDVACFSSCIDIVRFFRKLGAIQIGEDTGSDTQYAEVRDVVLPSGLSTFSTLQAIMPDYPRNIGPYVPEFVYTGDIADTAALEKWVVGIAAMK